MTPCCTPIVICGPLLTNHGIFRGPPSVNPSWTSPCAGTAAPLPPNENGRAFHAELPSTALTPPVYRTRSCGRLLPNAGDCANGDAAALLTLPLMRSAA